MTRVLIAEDHPLFRDGLAALLGGLPDVTVVDTTGTADGLADLAASCAADLAVVDLSLADGNALSTLEELHRIAPASPDPGPDLLRRRRLGVRSPALRHTWLSAQVLVP